MSRNDDGGWLLIALLAAVAFGGGVIVYNATRGLRNNNPGNIRKTNPPTAWQGLAAAQPDASFVSFESPEYGIRALAKTLQTYQKSYGLNTVSGIINRWAPPSENDTPAYVASVSKALGVEPGTTLTLDRPQMAKLVSAIIRHENGIQPYADSTIDRGLSLAGVV